MKRRWFLQATLATASAAGIAARSLAEPSPSPRLKIGFLGVGHPHAADKLKVVQESADWELIGFCEENAELQAKYSQAGLARLSAKEVIEGSQVVAVESNVPDHARHARLALAAGKHVHLEKPPATTVEDFRELVALARQKNVLMQMGYMWRYHPGINAAMEAARQGWLGDVYLVRGTINTQVPAAGRPYWGVHPGGTLFELGSHLIDALVRLLGRPRTVTPMLRSDGGFDDKVVDNALAVFEFDRAMGIVFSSTLQPGAGRHRSLEILGSNGTAIVNPIEPPALTIDLAKAAGPYRAGVNAVPMPDYRRYVAEFADLAARIRAGQQLAISPEDDLRVQEALIRACTADERHTCS